MSVLFLVHIYKMAENLEVTKKLEDGRFFCLHKHIKVNMNNFLFIYLYKRIIIIHRYPIYYRALLPT